MRAMLSRRWTMSETETIPPRKRIEAPPASLHQVVTGPDGITRNRAGQWLPGTICPNPEGRGRSGRLQFLRLLDDVLSDPRNLSIIRAALLAELEKDGGRFLRTFVYPLLPR